MSNVPASGRFFAHSFGERSAMAVRLELPRKKAPNPTDQYVGSRVRMRRKMLGMSQEKLGAALGLTFQQVQKYERGANRIGASRLQQMSHVLQVPLEFFFEGAPNASAPHGSNGSTLWMAEINDFISDPESAPFPGGGLSGLHRTRFPDSTKSRKRGFLKFSTSILPIVSVKL